MNQPLTPAERTLVTAHLPLAYGLAKQYWEMHRKQKSDREGDCNLRGGAIVQLDDLRQEATLALMQAVKRFDSKRQIPFGAYARSWVEHRLAATLKQTHAQELGKGEWDWQFRPTQRDLPSAAEEESPFPSKKEAMGENTAEIGMETHEVFQQIKGWASQAPERQHFLRGIAEGRLPQEICKPREYRAMLDSLRTFLGVKSPVEFKDFFTTGEVSVLTGTSKRRIRKWCESGKLCAQRPHGSWSIGRKALAQLLERLQK